jgi:sugar phosphate isomerase/epimerase
MTSRPPVRLRLGARAHDLGRFPADELARRVAALGLTDVQLALNKALAGPELHVGDLTATLAFTLRRAFEKHNVRIAVLGCYINPIHPDPATRAALLGWFKEHLRFASDVGCPVVALETGSVTADYSPHPDNQGEPAFQDMLRSFAKLVAEAERHAVTVGVEAVTVHTVSTPQRMRRLLDTIASPHLRVVLDPVNLLSPANAHRQRDVIREALDLLGDDIAIVHAKDFVRDGETLRTVPAGQGELDYDDVLRWLDANGRDIPVLLEETGADAVAGCRAHLEQRLRSLAPREGS